jgi:hypothetical protein
MKAPGQHWGDEWDSGKVVRRMSNENDGGTTDLFCTVGHRGNRALIVEIDARVAYAYIFESDAQIVSDVWLYNIGETPNEPEWTSPDLAPFKNPSKFARTDILAPEIRSCEELEACWGEGGAVRLTWRGELLAILKPGVKPGWSRMARQDGPVAQTLRL